MSVDQTRGSREDGARNVSVSDIGGVDVRLIAATAVMIAVVFVMTRVVQITIGPGGYIHFGDIALYVASFVALMGAATSQIAYTASKGGIEMFTKVAAVELGKYNIRVNCVAPGAVEVERTRLENPDYAGTWGRITPLGRVGQPADIGRAVRYMVGPESDFVTGQTIWVDGGMYARAPWVYSAT